MRDAIRRRTVDGVLDHRPVVLSPCHPSIIEDALRAKHRRPALSFLKFGLRWLTFFGNIW